MSTLPDTVAPPPSRVGRVVRWVFGSLAALVVLVLLGFGLWAASPGSLAQSIRWGQAFMANQGIEAGTLEVTDVEGSLLRGGRIASLSWQRDGLKVQATDTRVGLSGWFWADALLGRGVRLSQLDIARLQIDDQRPPGPPGPPEPLQPITLPLPVTLPWSIGELVMEGESPLTFTGLKGQYRYRPADSVWNLGVADAHQIDLDNLQVAGGRYQVQAVMGAQSPMPLRVDAQGEVQTTAPGGAEPVSLRAVARITGTLATVDASGRPWTRTVLLKACDESGFSFFTNYDGAKAAHIAADPRAALTFWWGALERQVNVTGYLSKVPREESEAYFAVRPLASQLGAWASPQSMPLEGRAHLERLFEECKQRFAGAPVPCPKHWGGYRLEPDTVEFWQGRRSRLHDRFRFTRQSGSDWEVQRLAP